MYTIRRSCSERLRTTYPFFTRLFMEVVSDPAVIPCLLATADIVLSFPRPIASMICISLLLISRNSSVMTAFSSSSRISLNKFTRTSLIISNASTAFRSFPDFTAALGYPFRNPETATPPLLSPSRSVPPDTSWLRRITALLLFFPPPPRLMYP